MWQAKFRQVFRCLEENPWPIRPKMGFFRQFGWFVNLYQKVRKNQRVAHDRAMKTCSDSGGVLSGSTRLHEID